MKLSAILAPLIAAKVPHEVILETVLAYEAQQTDALETSREKARVRWRNWKDRQGANVSKRLPTDSNLLTRAVEDKPLPTDTKPEEKKDTPRSRLEVVLDADHASAVIEHRQRLRKPLTERAAKMLAGELAKFPDPNAAADRMIGKGWLSIEASWTDSQARAGPQQQAPSMSQILEVIRDRPNENQPEPPEDRSGLRAAIPDLRVVGTR